MEEFVVYILLSKPYSKTYTGFTSNLIERIKSHNVLAKKGWTIKYRPWEVIHVEFYTSKLMALQREKFLKTGVGRDWVNAVILEKGRL